MVAGMTPLLRNNEMCTETMVAFKSINLGVGIGGSIISGDVGIGGDEDTGVVYLSVGTCLDVLFVVVDIANREGEGAMSIDAPSGDKRTSGCGLRDVDGSRFVVSHDDKVDSVRRMACGEIRGSKPKCAVNLCRQCRACKAEEK